ncbi:MAG: alpha-amylase [Kiritimatiellae bacterium]|nr:alpha-amylase [Kiritimatiellia bacterium]
MSDLSPFPRLLQPVHGRFERLYGAERAADCVDRLRMMIGRYGVGPSGDPERPWQTGDAALIAYADAVRAEGETPLATLRRFLDERMPGLFNIAHVLPFFPYSSDDGFSVIHYRHVRPDLGSWSDLEALAAGGRRLMVDLVLNHTSRESNWFRDYILGIAPGRDFFIEIAPDMDLSRVVRPRTSALATSVHTRSGSRKVWTTFSADQIDLNFANPDVLFEFLDLLFLYYSHGARLFRLDAIAYLWKTSGTGCIHLPQTHEIVALLRDVLELAMPDAALVTETNVPHEENVSYFGHGRESRMVYQFTLPPLLLHTLLSGDARPLADWVTHLQDPPPGCTFLNFTASHDGIGVRPLEGILPDPAVEALADHVRARGGDVSMRRAAGGLDRPYELNTTYFDALGKREDSVVLHLARFLCSQTIACALKGIPAIYFNSLVAAPNDHALARQTGRARSLNRTLWMEGDLSARLSDPASPASVALQGFRRILPARTSCEAFHPHGRQEVLRTPPEVFGLERVSPDGRVRVRALHNITAGTVRVPEGAGAGPQVDLISGTSYPGGDLALAPYQAVWLRPLD